MSEVESLKQDLEEIKMRLRFALAQINENQVKLEELRQTVETMAYGVRGVKERVGIWY